MSANLPARVFPLAHFIYEEMRTRGWKTGDVIEASGTDLPKFFMLMGLNLMMAAPPSKVIWHEETLCAVGAAFGVSPQFLRSIEKGWKDYEDRSDNWRCPADVLSPIVLGHRP